MHVLLVTEVPGAVGLFMHTQVIIPYFICRSCSRGASSGIQVPKHTSIIWCQDAAGSETGSEFKKFQTVWNKSTRPITTHKHAPNNWTSFKTEGKEHRHGNPRPCKHTSTLEPRCFLLCRSRPSPACASYNVETTVVFTGSNATFSMSPVSGDTMRMAESADSTTSRMGT